MKHKILDRVLFRFNVQFRYPVAGEVEWGVRRQVQDKINWHVWWQVGRKVNDQLLDEFDDIRK